MKKKRKTDTPSSLQLGSQCRVRVLKTYRALEVCQLPLLREQTKPNGKMNLAKGDSEVYTTNPIRHSLERIPFHRSTVTTALMVNSRKH